MGAYKIYPKIKTKNLIMQDIGLFLDDIYALCRPMYLFNEYLSAQICYIWRLKHITQSYR